MQARIPLEHAAIPAKPPWWNPRADSSDYKDMLRCPALGQCEGLKISPHLNPSSCRLRSRAEWRAARSNGHATDTSAIHEKLDQTITSHSWTFCMIWFILRLLVLPSYLRRSQLLTVVRSWKNMEKCFTPVVRLDYFEGLHDNRETCCFRSIDPIHLGRQSSGTCASDMSDNYFQINCIQLPHWTYCLWFPSWDEGSRVEGPHGRVNWMTVMQNPMGSRQKLLQEEDFRHRCAHHHLPKVIPNKCEFWLRRSSKQIKQSYFHTIVSQSSKIRLSSFESLFKFPVWLTRSRTRRFRMSFQPKFTFLWVGSSPKPLDSSRDRTDAGLGPQS